MEKAQTFIVQKASNGYLVQQHFPNESGNVTASESHVYVFSEEREVGAFFASMFNYDGKKRKTRKPRTEKVAAPEKAEEKPTKTKKAQSPDSNDEVAELKDKIRKLGGEVPRGRVNVEKLRELADSLEKNPKSEEDEEEEFVTTEDVVDEDED